MKKLFVSSTFRDMQLERDSLGKHVIPELNMRLSDYGTRITQTDLRWGISTSQMSAEEGEQKVLNVCLEEINKSRPYMIVMIGERYGWVPSSAIIEMAAKGRDIPLESNDISVTQLEIEYIAFTERWDESRIFFYFRDFDYADMSAQQRAVYESESDEAREKLDRLKARIEKKFPNQIRHYSLGYEDGEIRGIEQFERLVTDDLYNLFLRDVREDEKIDINERVRAKLHREAEESFPVYVWNYDISRGKSPDLAVRDVSRAEMTHTYLAGPPRCGKSLSVLSYYMAFYAYQNRSEQSWQIAEPLFRINNSVYEADGIYSKLPGIIDMERTFPLYLQLGNSKDIYGSADLWRTLLYFLNKHLGVEEKLPTEKSELIAALVRSLGRLIKSDKCFFLFVDDLTPEALDDLFCIEHSFDKAQIPALLDHFFFYASFNNQFSQVPVYVPFYNFSETCVYNDQLYVPADYFLAYAKKLGKEMSPAVTDYIFGYYGGYGRTYEDAGLCNITRPLANLMANYFMNFTSSDYLQIKEAGNDMNAIEAQNLALLGAVRGNLSDDLSGGTLRRVALLNIEKFEANHSERTLRMLGIIYLLTGISFSMDEAKQIYSYFGEEWSDLDYVSYFDDFKEFFVYNRDKDSYRVLPMFHSVLREHLVEKHFSDAGEIENSIEKLILAVQASEFYDRLRDELFYATLLVSDTEFVLKCLSLLKKSDSYDYELGKKLGRAAAELLNTVSAEEAGRLGATLSPILSLHFSCDALCGFFNGIGEGFQDHAYERKIIELANALMLTEPDTESEAGASLKLGVYLLLAYCYVGYKNDKALAILYEAESYVAAACRDMRVKYLSLISALMRKFEKDSPVYDRLFNTVKAYLPAREPLSYDSEREISACADLYTLAFYTNKFAISRDFYDADALLAPFLTRESFHKLGLYNIDTAIYAASAEAIGMEALIDRTTMFMESLSVHFPLSNYARRLISAAFRSRMSSAARVVAEESLAEEYEKHFYPYRKAVLHSTDNTGYHFINYALFLRNARFFHLTTGITHSVDEMMWEATKMSSWTSFFDKCDGESIDVLLAVCWVYLAYLRDPDFHDMISTDAYEDSKYSESDATEPSQRALHYRFVKVLCAVLHNPRSLIMKPKLKRQFRAMEEYYGDYMLSLSTSQYKELKKYIDQL